MPDLSHHQPALTRRRFLTLTGAAGASLALAPALTAQTAKAPSSGPLLYSFVNQTRGKFSNEQCFWSLDGGKQWHSFATQPTTPCPTGNGRVYFCLGALPKNFDDRNALWDFIEYAYGNGTWHGNTTQVDAFCLPITIELGDKRLGMIGPRTQLFDAFRKQAPKEFRACCQDDHWILSPLRAGFDKDGPHGRYFEGYMDEVWSRYAQEKPTPSGKWTGKVAEGALIFTPAGGGKALSCSRKPTTQEILLGTGILASNPQFCAAANRHVLADPADWRDPARFYQAEPCNWYSKFLHEHTIAQKCYGFCYDDVSEQAAFFSGKGDRLVVTLYWDSAPR